MHRSSPKPAFSAAALLCALALSAPAVAQSVSQPIGNAHPNAAPWQVVNRVSVPAIDRELVAAQDIARAGNGQPARFAIPNDVTISPNTHGTWEILDAKWSLWRLRIACPNAEHINLGFRAFSMPGAARMQIYSSDGTSIVRPFDRTDHQPTGELWTPIVFGKEIICEAYVPTATIPQMQLDLTHIGAGYRFFGAGPTALSDDTDGSGPCNIDVNCSQGQGWEDQISSVAAYSTGGSIFCTGAMINNTAQDGRNYFLTADHCGIGPGQASSLVCYWNYENTTCGGNNAPLNQFTTGSTYRAGWSTSDFTLVELNSTPNAAWGVTYAGWNRGSATSPNATAIHHPSGDAKKISFEYQATTHTSYGGSSPSSNGTHVRVADWDLGTTEPGSSGSPLFDNNQRIIGQLHGGSAACGNNSPDWYGRFFRSWTGGGSNSSRLSNWLDPTGSGVTVLDVLGGGGGGTGGSPLTTTFASNNGQAGNMFDLRVTSSTAPIVIDDFDVNLDSGSWDIEVYRMTNFGSHVGAEQNPSAWTLVASIPGVVSNGPDVPTPLGQSLGVLVDCTSQVGFYVTCTNGAGINYTTGTGFNVGDVYTSNADLEFLAGTGNVYPFGNVFGPPTSSRIFNGNIHYTVGTSCGGGGGGGPTATTAIYGGGCVEAFTSFYEQLTQANMDLSGLEIWGTAVTGGHQVNTRPATIMAIGSLGSATALALGDDDQTTAGTLGLSVGSNGWVARGTGNNSGYTPDVATMLSNPSEGYYAWTDLQPNATGSGQVYYEQSGTQWMVTYDGVYQWNTTDPVTIQFRGNESNGDFVIAFGSLTSTGPEDWLVGHSGAGASADPGARDLSQATISGFFMGATDNDGLELAPIGTPVLGAPFQLQTTNIPATAVFHCGIMGVNQLTVPLAFAFPSANLSCSLHASLNIVVGPQVVFGGPGSLTWTGVDLTSVSLAGASLYFQAATLDLSGLSDTVRTSNGVEAVTGN